MILLTPTTDIIRVITGGSQAIKVHASYLDFTSTTTTPGRQNTSISSNTTTTIVSAPTGSTQRSVKFVNIANTDSSVSDIITVQFYNGTDGYQLVKVTLLAGQTLTYSDLDGWLIFDAAGGRAEIPIVGRYLGTTVVTSASANFTTGFQTTTIRIRGVAGGGGGGGCTSVGSAASAAGGGGAGGYAEKVFLVSPNTLYAYTCGALGAGSSAAAGGTGGTSTFTVGSTVVTCNGGVGGPQAVSVNALSTFLGGAGGAVSTNGDVNGGGADGEHGIIVIVNLTGASGAGANTIFGGGGGPLTAAGTGLAATGYGAGGGGAMTGASAPQTGGAGTAGCWVIDEFS